MVDRDLLSSRLSALDGYLAELRVFRERSRKEFAQHVISDLGLRQAEGYKDAIAVLREEGILEAELAEAVEGWMGLRNVLVHLYLKIDHGRTYDAITTGIGDLERFAARMAGYLSE